MINTNSKKVMCVTETGGDVRPLRPPKSASANVCKPLQTSFQHYVGLAYSLFVKSPKYAMNVGMMNSRQFCRAHVTQNISPLKSTFYIIQMLKG